MADWNLHRFKAQPGDIVIEVESLRPNVFDAWLTYNRPGISRQDINGQTDADGVIRFAVPGQSVDGLAKTDDYLFLGTEHHLPIGLTDLHWGYRYRVLQNGKALAATDTDGSAIAPDNAGWIRSPIRPFTGKIQLEPLAIDIHY